MASRMSRRAVLKAIGVMPVAAAAGSAVASQQEQLATIADAAWNQRYDADLRKVLLKARAFFEDAAKCPACEGKQWEQGPRNQETYAAYYERIVRYLWGYFTSSIGRVSVDTGKRFTLEDELMVKAFDNPGHATGQNILLKLASWDNDRANAILLRETAVCAWRCGLFAAQAALLDQPQSNSVEIKLQHYREAWRAVQIGQTQVLERAVGEGRFGLFAGAC